jgi:lipopolysaccharide cholinephosphotransferase
MRKSNPHPDEKDLEYLRNYPSIRDGKAIIEEMDGVLRRNQDILTDYYVCLCNLVYDYKRNLFPKKDIDSLLDIDFYGHHVLIPSNYNAVLTTMYGDYMKLPPIEERGKWHAGSLYDPDRPYTEYVTKLWDKEKE